MCPITRRTSTTTRLDSVELMQGELVLNTPKHPVGLGCILDKEYLRSIAFDEVNLLHGKGRCASNAEKL